MLVFFPLDDDLQPADVLQPLRQVRGHGDAPAQTEPGRRVAQQPGRERDAVCGQAGTAGHGQDAARALQGQDGRGVADEVVPVCQQPE